MSRDTSAFLSNILFLLVVILTIKLNCHTLLAGFLAGSEVASAHNPAGNFEILRVFLLIPMKAACKTKIVLRVLVT